MTQSISIALLLAVLSGTLLNAQLLVPPPESAPDSKQVFEGRAGVFEFVAADQGSLQIARKIGREVIEVCNDLLTPPLERIPIIAVKLVPDGRGNLEGVSHRLYQDIAGDYGLAVSWNQQLSASLFVQALTESYLRQLVFTLSDVKRAEETPPWLIAGTSLRVQTDLRPALVEYLKELGRESQMVSLEDLVAKTQLSELTPSDHIASFWFLELISRQLGTEKKVRNFFDTVIAGRNPLELLAQQSEKIRTFSNGIEGWWVIGFQDLVHRENGIVLSLDRSARQLQILNRFELIERNQPIYTTAAGLWELRKNDTIKEAINGRLRDIAAVLPRVNPVYFTTFQRLGLVFQSLLENDSETFQERVEVFNEELNRANLIADDVQLLSEDPQAVIP
tara:strand:- start:17430 stop:18605 length:1176 start_codon:yes stop_codon:yes gene_type:complete